MSPRLLRAAWPVATTVLVLALSQSAAMAQSGGGQYGSTKEKTKYGTITITARSVRWSLGRSDGTIGTTARAKGSGPVCTYVPLGPAGTRLLGRGGKGPGGWYIPQCKFPRDHMGNPMPAVWVTGALPAPPASPAQLVQQAVADMALGGPHIDMSPPPRQPQIVNMATWLWISGAWQRQSATASAGPVAVTATAVPYKVVWNMGDGHVVTCRGRGTPYRPNEPASAQSTKCSYTYTTPSSRKPGGRFTVTATIYYEVSWVARGAPGGGNLGLVAGPSTRTQVRVVEAEALNTSGG
ncbi:MAG: hypothetical protein ACYDGN_12120 [Acidimicrobiales bacterium]